MNVIVAVELARNRRARSTSADVSPAVGDTDSGRAVDRHRARVGEAGRPDRPSTVTPVGRDRRVLVLQRDDVGRRCRAAARRAAFGVVVVLSTVNERRRPCSSYWTSPSSAPRSASVAVFAYRRRGSGLDPDPAPCRWRPPATRPEVPRHGSAPSMPPPSALMNVRPAGRVSARRRWWRSTCRCSRIRAGTPTSAGPGAPARAADRRVERRPCAPLTPVTIAVVPPTLMRLPTPIAAALATVMVVASEQRQQRRQRDTRPLPARFSTSVSTGAADAVIEAVAVPGSRHCWRWRSRCCRSSWFRSTAVRPPSRCR